MSASSRSPHQTCDVIGTCDPAYWSAGVARRRFLRGVEPPRRALAVLSGVDPDDAAVAKTDVRSRRCQIEDGDCRRVSLFVASLLACSYISELSICLRRKTHT
jgi:hypothetical protein